MVAADAAGTKVPDPRKTPEVIAIHPAAQTNDFFRMRFSLLRPDFIRPCDSLLRFEFTIV
jgi:hypothetical protein